MNSKISNNGTRLVIVFSSLLLIAALFFPLWKIDLTAPQYPEGLTLSIWAHKLAGNIDTINGLNHYIGMKKLNPDEFVEFKVLPGLLIFFSLFGVLVGIINRKKLLYAWMVLFIIFAAVSMTDFYYWEYDYGHSLDPTAPIQVPGMAYQPPFLGYKQMLNFGAFSIPDIGGWFFIGSGVLMFVISILQWKADGKIKVKQSVKVVALISFFFVSACNGQFKPINYGKDDCQYCKMTIVDKKFATEIISTKGKVFKFDDLSCVQLFVKENRINKDDIKIVYINNCKAPGEFLELKSSFLVKSAALSSPMGGNMAAFAREEDAQNYISKNSGELISNGIFEPGK